MNTTENINKELIKMCQESVGKKYQDKRKNTKLKIERNVSFYDVIVSENLLKHV